MSEQLELPQVAGINDGEYIRINLGLLTETELASALEIQPSTLQTWRREKKGPSHIKLGSGVFYRLEDVRYWILEAAGMVAGLSNTSEPQMASFDDDDDV